MTGLAGSGLVSLQLLVSKWCPSCPAAEKVWSEVAARQGLSLEVLDVGQPAGRQVAVALGVRTIPAIVIDGVLRAVGVSSTADAYALLASSARQDAPMRDKPKKP